MLFGVYIRVPKSLYLYNTQPNAIASKPTAQIDIPMRPESVSTKSPFNDHHYFCVIAACPR